MKKYLVFYWSILSICSAFGVVRDVKVLKDKGVLAFNDHFFTVSSNYFLKYHGAIKKENPEFAEATLLLVRSLIQEKRYSDVETILADYKSRKLPLTKKSLQQELDYWAAFLALTKQKFTEAEPVFRALIADAVEVEIRIKALTSLAESAFVQKQYATAKKLYLTIVSKYENSKEGQRASAELVKLFLLEEDYFWAEREIKRMAMSKQEEAQTNARALTILFHTLKGDEKKALTEFNAFISQKRSKKSSNIYLAAFSLGELLDSKKLHKEASEAYNRAMIFSTTTPHTERAMLKSASALIKAEDAKGAIAILDEFTKTFAHSNKMSDVLFTLAGLYKKLQNYSMALTFFETVVKLDKASQDLKFQAQMEVASCYILTDNSDKAIEAFLVARKLSEKDSDQAQSIFLAAEEAYRVKNFEQAAKYYQQIANEFKKSRYAENARFYQGLAFVKEKKYAEASGAFKIFISEFPESKLLPAVLFQHAIALKKQDRYSEAISFFSQFVTKFPDSRNVLQAILLQTEAQTELGDVTDAIRILESALVRYKAEELHPYVYSRLINLHFVAGDSNRAVTLSMEFMKKYDKSELTPEVLCRLADFYANSEDFKKAAHFYSQLATVFPKDKLTPRATLDTAIATSRFDKEQAIKLLAAIEGNKDFTDVIRAEAAFVHGTILAEKMRHKEAVKLFDTVVTFKEVPADLVQKATGRKGDCLFLDKQPAEAAAVYGSLLKSENLLPELADQVRFKLAETLISLKKSEDAEAILHDIVYQHSVESQEGVYRNVNYFIRAAFTLSDSYVLAGKPAKAIKVLKRVVELNLPISKEANQRIEILLEKMNNPAKVEGK